MASIQRLETRLHAGGPVIPDGANGTEPERLGARMDHDLWCARALADCPDLVHEVHRRYNSSVAEVSPPRGILYGSTFRQMNSMGTARRSRSARPVLAMASSASVPRINETARCGGFPPASTSARERAP